MDLVRDLLLGQLPWFDVLPWDPASDAGPERVQVVDEDGDGQVVYR